MSGILGIHRLDGAPVERGEIERMGQAMSHRGPDGFGTWVDGAVGLGHLMLHTTPESFRESLPLVAADGKVALTGDARLDNRAELRSLLGERELGEGGDADSELLLRAWLEWGESCVERLLGDFAFAVWDGGRRLLFCARDHRGEKPFFYHLGPSFFAFASEAKGLLALPEVPRRLNEIQVAYYLTIQLDDTESTFYRDIRRLPPAHCLSIGGKDPGPRSYWDFDRRREIRLRSDEEYAEAFREILDEAVACRLRSSFPVGVMLSGGLDSSAVVGVARALRGGDRSNLHTFSFAMDGHAESDESRYFRAVIDQGGIEPHILPWDSVDPIGNEDRMLANQDEPLLAPYTALYWELNRAASSCGVRVMMDGIDGDSTVSHGLCFLTELTRSGRWIRLLKEASALRRRLDGVGGIHVRQRTVSAFLPESALRVWRRLRGTNGPDGMGRTVIRRDFARRVALADRNRSLSGERRKLALSERDDHYLRLTGGAHPYILEIQGRTAAEFSVEMRHPLFDRRLAEFCLALPSEQKLRNGWTRYVMRRAVNDVIPPAVRERAWKLDPTPALLSRLVDREAARPLGVVRDNEELLAPYVDIHAVLEQDRRFRADGDLQGLLQVYWAASLGSWLRRSGMSM